MTRPPVRLSLLFLSTMLAGGCQVSTDPSGRTVISTPTLGQALGLSGQPGRPGTAIRPIAASGAVQEQRLVAGKAVQVIATGRGHAIAVDGRVLATDTEDDRVAIQGVYQGGGRVYVLISEQSGGIVCPSMYQAVDLSADLPVVSPQFGNCSDVPRVSVTSGALHVAVPAFKAGMAGARLLPAKAYVFKDGQMR